MADPEIIPPLRVPVTAAWVDEMQRRQAQYAARRARHTDAWARGTPPESPTETGTGNRSSRTIFDRRQCRFDF